MIKLRSQGHNYSGERVGDSGEERERVGFTCPLMKLHREMVFSLTPYKKETVLINKLSG